MDATTNAEWTVEVRMSPKSPEWITHSTHESYRDACDQSDMVHGRVLGNRVAYNWAVANQGFDGSYEDWCGLDDDERAEYEQGAAGIPTA